MKKTRQEVYDLSVDAVDTLRSTENNAYSAMDATRTEPSSTHLSRHQVGRADIINIPDIFGIMAPSKMFDFIKRIKGVVEVPIDVHCHDDFVGLAVANSLSAIEAGANR